MYGTVYRIRVRPGQEQALLELNRRWARDHSPRTAGYLGEYIYKLDRHPGEYVGVALFESREAYQQNADDPEQDRWYREFRDLLESDPEWNDGEIIYEHRAR